MDVNTQMIVGLAGLVTAICTAIYHIYKIKKVLSEDREQFKDSILEEIQKDSKTYQVQMDSKIQAVKVEVENLRYDVEKDLGHLKESSDDKIENLTCKIETLRDEVRSGLSSMVTLLTALVDKK